MKTITFIIALISLVISTLNAQTNQEADTSKVESPWELGGVSSVTLTQTAQKYWVKGGEPSLSYLATTELFAKYNKDNHSWESITKLAYGQQSQGYDTDFRTSEDRIELTSKYGYKASKQLFYSGLATFTSQFAKAYEYPENSDKKAVSAFMNPAYLKVALGMDYKPNKKTSLFLSPITSKTTMVLDTANYTQENYGLDSTQIVRNEMGAFLKVAHKMTLLKSVEMENNLELFSNYLDKPQNIDITWDLKIVMSINKYLKTILSTTLIYDDNIRIPVDINDPTKGTTKKIQFKEMLSVGLMVDF